MFLNENAAEIDLLLERGNKRYVFECKLSKAPKPSRGFYELVNSMNPDGAWIIAPVDESYEIKKGVWVMPPGEVIIT